MPRIQFIGDMMKTQSTPDDGAEMVTEGFGDVRYV